MTDGMVTISAEGLMLEGMQRQSVSNRQTELEFLTSIS